MTRRSIMYALASVTLGLLIGFIAANFRATGASAATTTASVAEPASLATQQGEDKPVEQTKKNIQVLKGLPTSQLMPLMNFIGASLGVKCAYCHVIAGKDAEGRNNWVWESDDKETKRTARRMMQMVLSVNNTNRADFRDNPLTCYTCHRGQTRPVGLPAMPLAASAHEDGGTALSAKPTDARATLPTVEQIINKYVEAVGGRAAISKSQTRVLKGAFEQTQGRNPAVEITLKEPGKYLLVLTTKEQGVIYQGFNGTTGWFKSDETRRQMSPAEVERVKRAAETYDVVKVREPYTGMTVAGRQKVNEREAYVLERKDAGGRTEKFFFDAETGLLLRRMVLTNTVLSPLPEQTDYEDYRDVNGLKLPFTIRTSNIDTFFSVIRKFTEIKSNVPIDDSQFNPPPAPAATPQKP